MSETRMSSPPPSFFASDSGATEVLRRARGRRRRQAAGAGSAFVSVVAVVVAVALVGHPGANADRLSVTNPSSPSPAPGHLRAGAPLAAQHGGSPSSQLTAGPNPAAAPLAGAPRPAAGTTRTPDAPSRRHSAAAPIRRTTVGYDNSCDPSSDVAGWCTTYTGPATARRKHVVTLSMEMCRVPISGDGTLTFSDTREVDFEALAPSTGKAVWRAGQGERFRSPGHTVTVKAGTCLRWTSTWDTIAPDGFYAPPGDYDMSVGVTTDNTSFGASGATLTLTD